MQRGQSNDTVTPWRLVRAFLSIFLAFTILLVGIAAAHYYTRYRTERVTREASEQTHVQLAQRLVVSDIAAVVSDLRVLARQIEELDLNGSQTLQGDRLERSFRIFAEQKRLYDQIRFIDIAGRELIRVNFDASSASVVTADRLQDKSRRYYVREIQSLGPGEIYVSPLDLNVEQGAVERPFKPMMRFAMPVFDAQGKPRGMVVLNYLGHRLLERFRQATVPVAGHIHLLNQDGYWLSSPNPGDSWGFMFGEERTFGRSHPEEWQRILHSDAGQFQTQDGLFTFATVAPSLQTVSTGPPDSVGTGTLSVDASQTYVWKIVAALPLRVLGAIPGDFVREHATLYGAMLLLLGLGSLLLARSRLHHRQAEMQSEYERRFRRALEDIELAAVTLDRYGRVVFCNDYLVRLTGRRPEEILDRAWMDVFTPDEQKATMGRVLGLLSHPEQFPARYTGEILTRDGERRLMSWHNTLSGDGRGGVLGVTAIGEDITETRRYEDQLRKLNRAVEQSPSIVLITDRSGRIEYVNPKFTEVTGYRLDEVRGKNPRVLKSGETSPDDYTELWQTIVQGGEWRGEFHNRRKNGELYWEAASISALRDAEGAITHFLAVKEDITERKRLEQEVELRNREIARTQALAEVGRMANMIAHDLRNPLSSIKMSLQILNRTLKPQLDAESAELQGIALGQIAYMEDILADMLTYSRPTEASLEWLGIERLLETALGLARRRIQRSGLSVETQFQHGLPSFPGDANQLRQVFSNLITNAVQATDALPSTERRLIIRTGLDLSPGGTRIRVEICDNGCGVADQDPEQLFEPFYTTRAKGTGLGLAIVRRILDCHGASVTLRPNQPQGTCAEVLLPTVPSEGVQMEQAPRAAIR